MSKKLLICYLIIFFNIINCLQWEEPQELDEAFSSVVTMIDDSGNLWRCGGKVKENGVTTVVDGCRALSLSSSTWSEAVQAKGVKQATTFPGFYTLMKGYFSEVQNTGGYYKGTGCMIGLNDATNSAKCYCCDFESSGSDYICDALTNNGVNCQTKIFGQCVTPDNNRLMEIGGASGSTKTDGIKAFSLETKRYVSHEYRNLVEAVSNHGCTMTGDGTIVVVGGETNTNSYRKTIQVCKQNQNCYLLDVELNEGVEKTRCTATVDDNIVVCMGGRTDDGISNKVMVIDITAQTVDYDTLPTGLVEFSIYADGSKLCLVNGVQMDGSDANIGNKVYCTKNIYTNVIGGSGQNLPPSTAKPTSASPTNRPTQKPTTRSPTERPTNRPTNRPTTEKPTNRPTRAPTPEPTPASKEKITLNALSLAAEYEKGRESQICASDSYRIYHFGGITEEQRDTNEFLAMNSNLQDSRKYSVLQKANALWTQTMSTLYCKHQCSVMYEDSKSMFIVSPIIPVAANNVYFYKCNVDSSNQQTLCFDLCTYDVDKAEAVPKSYCSDNKLRYFNPCVTKIGQYLIIIGGYSGNELFDGIIVYDMAIGEFLTTQQKINANLNFGNLAQGVKSASCAAWNGNLYVFGGIEYATGNTPSSLIQICEPGKECYIADVELKQARFDSKAVILGSQIVITCGSGQSYKPIGEIEIFDCEFKSINSAPFHLEQPTSHCCLNTINNLIVVSGGSSLQLNGLKDIYSTPFELAPKDKLLLRDCDTISFENEEGVSIEPKLFGEYAHDSSVRIPGYSTWISKNGYGTGMFYNPAIPAIYIGGNNNIWFTELTGTFDSSSKFISISPTYPTNKYYTFTLKCVGSRIVKPKNNNDGGPFGVDLWVFIVIVILLSIFIIGIFGLMIYYFIKIRNNDYKTPKNHNIVNFKVKSTSEAGMYRPTNSSKSIGGIENEPLSPRVNTFSETNKVNIGGYTPNMLFGETTNENYQKDIDNAIEQQENSDTDIKNIDEVQLDQGYNINQNDDEEDITNQQITPNVLFPESQL